MCEALVSIVFTNLGEVPVGGWFWAYGLGFLEIVSFNPETSEITLTNPCPENPCQVQAAPGTPIPANTPWILTIPPCPDASSNPNTIFPYLAVDFTAPANGDCIDITVTNVNGIGVNKNVTIAGGIYRVDAVLSSTLITICNDGAGVTPGTPVIAKDNAGNFLVPIVLVDSNPCNTDPVLAGVPLVCASGVTYPLVGSESGQVLVYDHYTGESNFRTLGIPVLDCTELTVCLTLDPDLPEGTPYLATVVDTSLFTEGQIVTIGGTTFTVDTIDDATHMHLIPTEVPTAIQTYPVGATVCSADCCTQLEDNCSTVETWEPTVEFDDETDATITDVVVNSARYSAVCGWVQFKLSVNFTIAGDPTGAQFISITPPPIAGVGETLDAYICHSDEAGVAVDPHTLWRYTTTSEILVFKLLLADWEAGAARIDISDKYERLF